MENAENQVSYIQIDPHTRRIPHAGSNPGTDPGKSFADPSKDLSDIRGSLDINKTRLKALEDRKAAKVPATPRVDPEAGDERWVQEMLSLGGEGKEGIDISAARERIIQRSKDEKLTSGQAKRESINRCQDDAWVKRMLAHGGQVED